MIIVKEIKIKDKMSRFRFITVRAKYTEKTLFFINHIYLKDAARYSIKNEFLFITEIYCKE